MTYKYFKFQSFRVQKKSVQISFYVTLILSIRCVINLIFLNDHILAQK